MSFHTPRCRITATAAESDFVVRDFVVPDKRLALFMYYFLDPTLPAFGIRVFDFRLIAVPEPFGAQSEVFSHSSSSFIKDTPVGSGHYWLMYFDVATNWTKGKTGFFLFEPRIFLRLPGDVQEFAYPEEPHYILIREV